MIDNVTARIYHMGTPDTLLKTKLIVNCHQLVVACGICIVIVYSARARLIGRSRAAEPRRR